MPERKIMMSGNYIELLSASEPIRKIYADSVSNAVAVLRVAANIRREHSVTPSAMARRRDEYRAEFAKMLGIDTCQEVFGKGIPSAEVTKVGEDSLAVIERIKFKICDGVHFTGLLLKPHQRAVKAPLVVMAHGGGGSPELCCDIIVPNNYGGIVRRMLARGVIIFAPQLLLWNLKSATADGNIPQYSTPYNRAATDNEMKQCGTSIAGFEIYEITRALDYLLAENYIDPEKCGMTGLSYGGFYTLYSMAYDTRIKSGWSAAFFNDRIKYCNPDFVWHDSARRFLDAEIAGLCAPRRLWIDIGKTDSVFSNDSISDLLTRVRNFYSASDALPALRLNLWNGGHRYSEDDEAMDFLLEGIGAFI
jgi:dienelactone hydrolase/uncharacterized protein YoaH (UPF0181 family)